MYALLFIVPIVCIFFCISAIVLTLSRPSIISVVVVAMATLPWLTLIDFSQYILAIPVWSLLAFGISFIRPQKKVSDRRKNANQAEIDRIHALRENGEITQEEYRRLLAEAYKKLAS
jgi:Sec-independent protein secretion pathway component TatC